MNRRSLALSLLLAASLTSPTFAQGKSKKDIPPPIEVTGNNRRLNVISQSPTNDHLLQYDTPDRQDKPTDKPVPSRLRIFIPGNHKTIKGIVFDLGYTYTCDSTPLQAVAREEGWAVIGCLLRYKYGTEILNTALKEFAEKSKHTELLTAPIIPMGFSRNGSRAWDFAEENPDRTLALALGGNPAIPSGMLNFDRKTNKDVPNPDRIALAQAFPALTVVGSRDPFVDYDKGEARFWHNAHYPRIRAQEGVTWGMMIGWGYGHGWEGSWTPFVTFFQDCFTLRGDGAPLKKIAFEDGYFAEYGWKTDWPEIAPVKEFKGDKTKAIWLPAANTAHVWRAFQVEKPKVTFTVEGSGKLVLKAVAPDATTSVEFFDRATSLGVVSGPLEHIVIETTKPSKNPGEPPEIIKTPYAVATLTTDKLATGTRAVFAVATTPAGKTPSRPITVAGGKALDWKQGEADWKTAERPENVAHLTPPARKAAQLLAAIAAAKAKAEKSPDAAPAPLPAPAESDVAALRKELDTLFKDPFVEQRDAAGKLGKMLPP